MTLITLDFPENLINNKEEQNILLDKIKDKAYNVVELWFKRRERNAKDEMARLENIEEYIETTYKKKLKIKTIIFKIIDNLKYDADRENIILDADVLLENIPLVRLARLIRYGELSLRGSDVIQSCFKEALYQAIDEISLIKWGVK